MVVRRICSSRVFLAAAVFAAFAGFDIGAAPRGTADPQVMADRWTQFVTDDGWVIDVNTTNEVIDHIDNMAGASNSWQARVSVRAEARISGSGSAVIQDAQLEAGYFVGCRTDSSAGVEVGADIGIDPYQQVNGQVYGGGYGGGGSGVVRAAGSAVRRAVPRWGCRSI